jgi:hypothetical protein
MQLNSGKVKSTAVSGSEFVLEFAEEAARRLRIQSDHPKWKSDGVPTAFAHKALLLSSHYAALAAEEAATCIKAVEELF